MIAAIAARKGQRTATGVIGKHTNSRNNYKTREQERGQVGAIQMSVTKDRFKAR
jgi:hypothetical protein